MAEAGDIEIRIDPENGDKGTGVVQTLTPEELKRKAARVKQMEQLNMKIKTLKTMMTKNMNGLEKEFSAFKKLESEHALVKKVRRKAIDVTELQGKLQSEKKEMENTTTVLKDMMGECEKDELGESQEKAIDRLDANIEKYLERYEEIVENKEEVLARAEYAGVQTITSSTAITVEQTSQPIQYMDKFTAYTELKPKFLEKESTLLD